jgi:hypothetical protein
MTKNQQVTIGIIVLAVVVVYLAQAVKERDETIQAQEKKLSDADFAWWQENRRANQHAAESNRKSVEITRLQEQIRALSSRAHGEAS